MSSFGSLAQFRVGYWRGIREFILNERRDVAKRIEVLDAEIERIGLIRVQYERTKDSRTGKYVVTENRVGLSVSKGTSLERLLQAYIAAGGNPFDISHFFYPDETQIIDDKTGETVTADNYPYGGVAAPLTANYNEPVTSYGEYPGGYVPLAKYLPNRVGARYEPSDTTDVVAFQVDEIRKSCNKEIRNKIQELEHRIIKLCDLREQLLIERDEVLIAAHGGTLYDLPDFDPDFFADHLLTQYIISQIDSNIFETTGDGRVKSLSTPDAGKVTRHESFYLDKGVEVFLMLMA